MTYRRAGATLALACVFLTGCQGALSTTERFRRGPAETRVLLMPIDIQLAEMTAAGLQLPNAEWTAQAERHVTAALSAFMAQRGVRLVAYRPPADRETARAHGQLIKLHETVRRSLLEHQFTRRNRLPTKSNGFDWSLGREMAELGEGSGADYALFLLIRDSYTSAGRLLQVMLSLIRFGVLVPAGRMFGVASLVDLRSGRLVWFNRVLRDQGDLRKFASAEESVRVLLVKFPK